jgi:CO/xanthine dehydrogenase FAD-binding subunit
MKDEKEKAMLRELTSYHRPGNLRDALQLLKQPHMLPLAGGTDLLGRSDTLTQSVIDLQELGLDYMRAADDGVHIGAMTRIQAIIDDPAVGTLAGGLLARSALSATVNTVRHAATLGGALAAAPAWSDLLPALLVLDAVVEVQTEEARSLVPAEALLASREHHLPYGALITEIILPVQPTGAKYAAERVSRTPADRAIVCLALCLAPRDGAMRDVRIAAGGASDHALRLTAAEKVLEGAPLSIAPLEDAARAAMNASEPPSDHLASSDYRRAMVGLLLTRAVNETMKLLASS